MSLKYSMGDLFRGKFLIPKRFFEVLEDLDSRFDEGVECEPVIKTNVKLTKTSLKKAFGDPKDFKKIGIVHNSEGSYLIIASDKSFKHIALENI